MGEQKNPVYVVLTLSGKVWPQKVDTGYFGILSQVFAEMQSAGSGWDAPWRLLRNGEMVVPSKLNDLAFAYGDEDRKARGEAYVRVQGKHAPEWLTQAEAS